jgi:hypothetical protein
MKSIQLESEVGPDGVLELRVPMGGMKAMRPERVRDVATGTQLVSATLRHLPFPIFLSFSWKRRWGKE